MTQSTNRLHGLLRTVLLIAMASCNACPQIEDDPAPEAAWVRQVVPALHGRQPRSSEEVRVLAQLTDRVGKATVAQGLMEQPEFLDHWSNVLMDRLEVQRTGVKSQADCYTPFVSYSDPALAEHIRDQPPGDLAPGAPAEFNMRHVLRSALATDDLFPLYRAHLFALTGRPLQGAEITEELQERDLSASFQRVFLNRQHACLRCHNSERSVTGERVRGQPTAMMDGTFERALVDPDDLDLVTDWDRTHPAYGAHDRAAFGTPEGLGDDRALQTFFQCLRPLGGGCPSGDHDPEFPGPWGLDDCGTFDASRAHTDITDVSGRIPHAQARIAGWSGSASSALFDLDARLKAGYDRLRAEGYRRTSANDANCTACASCDPGDSEPTLTDAQQAREDAVVAQLRTSCAYGPCHDSSSPAAGVDFDSDAWKDFVVRIPAIYPYTVDTPSSVVRVMPGNASQSTLLHLVDDVIDTDGDGDTDGDDYLVMPPSGSVVEGLDDTVRAWIDGMPQASGCSGCTAECQTQPDVDGEAALAFLVAQKATSDIWEEVMGAPLTIANYYPRTRGQRWVRGWLTEWNFLQPDTPRRHGRWSLRTVLTRIVASTHFARNPPDTAGRELFTLPLALDPWVQEDLVGLRVSTEEARPAFRQEHNNSVGEVLHRRSASSLLRATHLALGWPETPWAPDGRAYPSDALIESLGQYLSEAQPGGEEVGFQGLLAWEDAVGQCRPPGVDVSDDFVSVLLDEARSTPSATVQDVVRALKDRLVSDPSPLTLEENQAFAPLFGVTGLLTPASEATALQAGTRRLCGALLTSPQFLLQGVSSDALPGTPLRLRPTLPGEPLTYEQECSRMVVPMASQGVTLTCGPGGLTVASAPSERRDQRSLVLGQVVNNPDGRVPDIDVPPNNDADDPLCPHEWCGMVTIGEARACIKDAAACPSWPPMCDPRCTDDLLCCGDPSEGPTDTRQYVAWADGGSVLSTAGAVVVRTAGARDWAPLAPGTILRAGDIVRLEPGHELQIDRAGMLFQTPPGGLRAAEPRLFVVTSEVWQEAPEGEADASLAARSVLPLTTTSETHIESMRSWPAYRWMPAGPTMLDLEQPQQ
ncbi:MAG: hypothetical protein KTR31_30330 [Myxococcales bacterium]|nr:hypothetical protein [Myxococcales bacterium]